jgi:hypothetical protein
MTLQGRAENARFFAAGEGGRRHEARSEQVFIRQVFAHEKRKPFAQYH